MAVYVPPEYEKKGGAKAFADKIIDMIEGFVETRPDTFVMTRSVVDVKEQFGESPCRGRKILAPCKGGNRFTGAANFCNSLHI